jgi:hypothetical protein
MGKGKRVVVLSLCLLLAAGTVYAQCVTGTVTAEFQTTGPYAGLWKYTLEVEWDTPFGLSNITLDCGFGCNPEAACEKIYAFDTPAGTSTGEPEPCIAEYSGEFNCQGNPSVGITDPIVKWDALNNGCEPGPTGSGVFCFYTNIPPVPDSPTPVTIIKDGQDVCTETIMGDCPALCPVANEGETWGFVKEQFKK